MYSPDGLVGIWRTLMRRLRPAPEEAAAMSKRRIYEGLPLPGFLLPEGLKGTVLEVEGISKHFGGIRAVTDASLTIGAGEIHALIGPNGAGKTTLFNLISGLYPTDAGTISLNGREIQGVPSRPDLSPRPRAFVPDHQSVPRPVDLRKSAAVAAGAAAPCVSTSGATSTAIRQSTPRPPN